MEREIVNLHKDMGVPAERVPLSGAAGGRFSGDIQIGFPLLSFLGEVKSRKSGEGFKTLERWLGENDLLFLKRDRQSPMVLMDWESYAEIWNQVKNLKAEAFSYQGTAVGKLKEGHNAAGMD